LGPLLCVASWADPTIRSVTVKGTQRPVTLDTRAGTPLNTAVIRDDVRALWAAGWVSDVRVESTQGPLGADIVFHLVEKPVRYLGEVRVTGAPAAGNKVPPGTRIDEWVAHQTASNLENHLQAQGYRDAAVRPTLAPDGPFRSDLHLAVTPGPKFVVNRVRFTGNLQLKPRDLEGVLRASKPRTIVPAIWRSRPALTSDAVASDAARLRSLYAAAGYLDAAIRPVEIEPQGPLATIEYQIDAGQRYTVESLHGAGIVAKPPSVRADGSLPHRELCDCFTAARRRAESEGRLDFEASLLVTRRGREQLDLSVRAETGPPYRVGRIEFSGHHAYGDSTLRRALRLDEGDLLDRSKLQASLARIDSLGLFQPVTADTAALVRDPESRTADIRIALQQRSRGRLALSGPAGPFSLGGPLHASIASRLPAWGRGLVEASTYYLTFNVVGFSRALPIGGRRTVFPYVALSRPLLPGQEWTSGFALSPQIGWRTSAANYAITQAHARLRRAPWLSGRAGHPALTVPIKAEGETVSLLLCEPPEPKPRRLRAAAVFALDWFLGARMF
jgi:outer membrane protein insertion porin family